MLRPYRLLKTSPSCRPSSSSLRRPLAADRQIPAVANSAIGLNFNQPANVHLDLLAEIAFHAAFLLDGLANVVDFLFGQVADFFRVVHAGFRSQLFRALPPDAVDGG